MLHPARFLPRLALLAASLGLIASAAAQPSTVRMLVGFPPGGTTDSSARILAEGMSKALDRPVVVENRPGAGGQLAANALKQAAPDGGTVFLSNSHALSMIPLTIREPGYETLEDFTAVGLVSITPDVMAVNPDVVGNDVTDLKGLIEWVEANPDKGSIGVPAPASDPEFGVRLVALAFDAEVVPVPYRGDAPAIQDLLAGQIPAAIGGIGAILPYAKSGDLRIIAVSGPERLDFLPEVATYVEQGVENYGISNYTSLLAPAGTPPEIIERYNEVLAEVVGSDNFKQRVSTLGVIPATSTPEELTERIRATNEAFQNMIDLVGYTPQ